MQMEEESNCLNLTTIFSNSPAEAFFLCTLMNPPSDPSSHTAQRRSTSWITGSNSAERMVGRLMCLLCVV